MKRDVYHRGALLLAVAIVIGACGGSAQPPASATPVAAAKEAPTPTPRDFGKVQVGDSGVLLLWGAAFAGVTKGLYKEQGIDYDRLSLNGPVNTLNAVIAGDIPFGLGGLDRVIEAASKGVPLRAIGSLIVGFPNTVILRKDVAAKTGLTDKSPFADRMKALKGRTIGLTSAGGPVDVVMRLILESVGMVPDRDVTLTYVGTAAASLAAIKSGKIDATLVGSPTSDQAISDGDAVVWGDLARGEFAPLKGMAFSVLFARADYIAKNEALAQAMLRAQAKALAYIQTDRTGARAAMRPFFKELDEKIYNVGFDNTYVAWPTTPVITEAGFKATLDLLNARKDVPRIEVTFSAVVDNRFAQEAIK